MSHKNDRKHLQPALRSKTSTGKKLNGVNCEYKRKLEFQYFTEKV
jgi:hypothetical protein